MSADLAVSLTSSRATLRDDDAVDFTVQIQNTSARPVVAPPRRRPYAMSNITVRGMDGARLKAYARKDLEFAPETAQDVEPLVPGGKRILVFHATLLRGTVHDEQLGTVRGLFLDFDDSAIQIPGPGQYQVEARFERTPQYARELETLFRISNVWRGKLVSKPIGLTIAE